MEQDSQKVITVITLPVLLNIFDLILFLFLLFFWEGGLEERTFLEGISPPPLPTLWLRCNTSEAIRLTQNEENKINLREDIRHQPCSSAPCKTSRKIRRCHFARRVS